MKYIDLVQSVESTFVDPILQQLSAKFGASPEVIKTIIEHAVPVLVASLMARAALPGGVEVLFSTVMSPESNARIGDQLAGLTMTTAGIKDLELLGDALTRRATDRRIAAFSDKVAGRLGVPAQPAHVLSALVAAALFGTLKHHVLLEQAASVHLPSILAHQLPAVAPYITDGVAPSLGCDSAATFTGTILGQLDAVSSGLNLPEPPERAVGSRGTPPDSVEFDSLRRSVAHGGWIVFATLTMVLVGVGAYAYACGTQGLEHIFSIASGAATKRMTPAVSPAIAGQARSEALASSAPVPIATLPASVVAPVPASSATVQPTQWAN